MTNDQKEKTMQLRNMGYGYADIGRELGISRETVKSFCRRKNIQVGENNAVISGDSCRYCNQPITQVKGKKRRSFCSKECCLAWWHAHPESLHKKALYTFICTGCGKEFTAYGNSKRKYCSHDCYISSRFKGGDKNGRTEL